MRELVPAIWDDLDLSGEISRKVPAQGTVTLGFMGEWAELDLTSQHIETLEKMIRPWMAAGHKPDKAPRPARQQASRRSKIYYEGLRAWAESEGIKITQNAEGKRDYPRRLRQRYDEHLASQAVS